MITFYSQFEPSCRNHGLGLSAIHGGRAYDIFGRILNAFTTGSVTVWERIITGGVTVWGRMLYRLGAGCYRVRPKKVIFEGMDYEFLQHLSFNKQHKDPFGLGVGNASQTATGRQHSHKPPRAVRLNA